MLCWVSAATVPASPASAAGEGVPIAAPGCATSVAVAGELAAPTVVWTGRTTAARSRSVAALASVYTRWVTNDPSTLPLAVSTSSSRTGKTPEGNAPHSAPTGSRWTVNPDPAGPVDPASVPDAPTTTGRGRSNPPVGNALSPLTGKAVGVADTGVPVGPEVTDWSKPEMLERQGKTATLTPSTVWSAAGTSARRCRSKT